MAPIRILAVDDHPMVREGLSAVIATQPDMVLLAEDSNGADAIESFRRHRPDITLMDLQMPGMSGIEAIRAIRSEFPSARIVVLTTYRGDAQALASLKAGAVGYLLKSMLRKELLETIRAVHAGKRKIDAGVASDIAAHAADDALSLREVEVLQHVSAGCGNKQVAARLGVTEDTIKAHMKSILAKLDAQDRAHAVAIALRRGIL